ncbi:hypothetical protein [Nocardioides sp. Iso805N]|uniref:hypothetical protein n=1 Tax=Nocardioides sp. Iso805N TaxID=1283287 RepID=UPI0012F865D4|nr:hypothetical protein [Nocardioides sp. Iso805N]
MSINRPVTGTNSPPVPVTTDAADADPATVATATNCRPETANNTANNRTTTPTLNDTRRNTENPHDNQRDQTKTSER